MWFHRGVTEPEPTPPPARGSRVVIGVVVGALTIVIAAASVVAWQSGADEVAVAPRPTTPPIVITSSTTSTTTSTTEAPTAVPKSTPLAAPKGVIPNYDVPDGQQIGTVGVWYDFPMTMPIVEERGAWLRIRLPERPNGKTAWVRRSEVTVSASAYRIVIDVDRTTLTVFKDGNELFSAPVGVGNDATPTPRGSFFAATVLTPGPSGYGSVVIDTSGHSEAIQSWQGSGDAVTSIHGPISAASDARIGTTGTKISNGCIRMHAADQIKLAVVPVGSPVDIV